MTSIGKVHADSEVVGRIDAPGLNSASGITFDGDIHPLVVDGSGEVIWRVNIFDASVIATYHLSGGPATIRSLDYDFGSGAYYVSRREAGVNDTLFTVDPANGTVDEVGLTGVNFYFLDQALGPAGYLWLITDNGGGELWLVDKATGEGFMVQGYDGAMGDLTSIAIGPEGEIIVASLDGHLYEINHNGGIRWVNTTGLSGEDYFVDFEYDPFSGRWYGIEERRSVTPPEWYLREITLMWQWAAETVPSLRFIDPPGGESVGSVYQVRFEATDVYGGTTIDVFYTPDEMVCNTSGDPCAEHGDCQVGELCRHSTTIGSDAVHPIGQIQKERPGTLPMSVDWNIEGIQDGRYVVFAKLTPGEGADGTERSFTRPHAGPNNVGDGMLAFGTCSGDETACNRDDDCTSGDICIIPPDAVDITGDKARLETWTAVCIDPQAEEWRINGTLTQPVLDYNDPSKDPYDHAFTGVPYTSMGGEVTFTITRGSVPFALEDKFLFTTTGITDVSKAVTISEGRISGAPIAIIHAAPLAGFAPLAVMFDGRDSYDPNDQALQYWWDFGDGSPQETGAVVNHTYVDAGMFTAVLRTINPLSGRFGEAAVDIEVINRAPNAQVTATPTSGPAPLDVQFGGAESVDAETPADQLIFQWDFGDGTTANDALVPGTEFQTVTHLYEQMSDGTPCTPANPCTFTATLTVIDEAGAEDIDTIDILVGNTNPNPVIFHSALQGPDPWKVIYNASNSWDPDGDPLTVEWLWGDGSPAEIHPLTGSVPHTYTLPGTYLTRAVVRDTRGGSTVWSAVVVVTESSDPRAIFTIDPPQPACNEPFTVDGSLSFDRPPGGQITLYLWEWGDGTPSGSGVMATHKYTRADLYHITLTVFDAEDPPNTDTTSKAILIIDNGTCYGDLDGDGDVDLDDFAHWGICVTGPAGGPCAEGCQALDLDGDTDVDIADFAGFQLAFTGSRP